MTPVLEISNISRSYRTNVSFQKYWILRDLSFSVEAGEIFGFIGPNGAGKTTTIKLVMDLIRPDGGSIRIFGRKHDEVQSKSRIGFLPENPYFYDYLTAREFLDFYGRLFGLARPAREARIRELLARVGLANRADRQLRKFSKGMLQRIGLAQALINDPDLVILDEPMSGLDPVGRREVRDLILSLKEAGKTIFFSTHILSDTELICDRVGILSKGDLKAVGKVSELLADRVDFWEVTFSGVSPGTLPGIDAVISRDGDKTLVRARDEEAMKALAAAILREGGSLQGIVPHRERLEDLFLREIKG
ncbi:MAG TPA: ABC transporter ATP-binding protein [Candidatus Polarisedimenticolia bacterium]|jgi:ABC-2 type transport system ATP-binding protein|nr:ABC transporter ATP-binding protein [Candidatus Polarisedimenticolia bacterium]